MSRNTASCRTTVAFAARTSAKDGLESKLPKESVDDQVSRINSCMFVDDSNQSHKLAIFISGWGRHRGPQKPHKFR